jgi:hypothetical protein
MDIDWRIILKLYLGYISCCVMNWIELAKNKVLDGSDDSFNSITRGSLSQFDSC